MKINLEELSKLERKLNIEVPVEKVTEAFTRVYKELQSNVSMKGFRKGKTPLDMIKKMYKDRVLQDVIENLVREHYPKALMEKALSPISYPSIEFDKVEEGNPFKFSASFEVRPDVSLHKYKGLDVQKELLVIDEKQVASVLENLRSQRADMTDVLEVRGLQKEDVAVFDFEGVMDGQALENASGKHQQLKIGTNQFIPGFEDGMLGMKTHETRTLNLTFPKDYHAAQLAGKAVEFKVTLTAMKKEVLPEMNDEFATRFGKDTMAQLKEAVEKDLRDGEERRIKEELKNRLMKLLVKENPVDVPSTLLTEQKKMLEDDVVNRMKGQGVPDSDVQEYVKKWDDDFAKSATFIIQSSFLINAVAAKESIEVNDSDFDKKIEDFAVESGIDEKTVRQFYNKPDQRSRLEFQLLEEKVVEFLLKEAKLKEVSKDKLADLN